MRVRVAIDVSKLLLHGKKFNVGTNHSCWIRFFYERLSNFCYYCGCLGHNFKKCSRWEYWKNTDDPQCLPYGQWLRVESHRSSEPFKREVKNPTLKMETPSKYSLPNRSRSTHTQVPIPTPYQKLDSLPYRQP